MASGVPMALGASMRSQSSWIFLEAELVMGDPIR
jgi:hypothetical protein